MIAATVFCCDVYILGCRFSEATISRGEPDMEERLQKILSRYGVASRRQSEVFLQEGRVRVNGNTAKLGDTADEAEDVIEVDGVRLKKAPPKLVLMLNKPRGYVTTMQDEKGRKNVSELVSDCGYRVYPVGRLDLFSEGLLLMTNDGELANKLMHPKGEIKKLYHVWVSQYYTGAEDKIADSIDIDGKKTRPAKVKVLHHNGGTAMLEVELSEGRNRQIRRLCEHAGVVVTRLKRVKEGNLQLGDLPVGKWRVLSEEEIKLL